MSKIETNTIAPSTGTTLTLGESGDTVQVGTGVTATGFGGITEADQWRINSDLSVSSAGTFTSNWERVDTDGFAKIGTGLTESSGVFSFPSTGIYNISYDFLAYANGAARTYFGVKILTTLDNSAYSDAAISYSSAYTNTAYGNMSGNFLFNDLYNKTLTF